MGVARSHSEKKLENCPILVLIFSGSIPCVLLYTLIKVVSHNDLSVLSMSVMGFQKKLEGG